MEIGCAGHDMVSHIKAARPQGYKTFFMLNTTEHEIIPTAHKN